MMRAAEPNFDFYPGEDSPEADREAALHAVYEALRRRGPMPAETAWRTMREIDRQMAPWGEHSASDEIGISVFVSVVLALLPMVERQQAAFDKAAAELARERKRSVFRKRRAQRRAKKDQRKAERPAKVRAFVENRQANRDAPPRPAPVKTPARGPARPAPVDMKRAQPKGAPQKNSKPKGPVGRGGKR